jgi:hypothetical protein
MAEGSRISARLNAAAVPVALVQRDKLRGFGAFVAVRHWQIFQSLRLLQDDIRGIHTLGPLNLNVIGMKRRADDRLRPMRRDVPFQVEVPAWHMLST